MKVISVAELALPAVKVIRFARFRDQRGYFTEPFRRSDFDSHPDLTCFRGLAFVQANESHSRPNVVRGLHFQFSPFMGKLVRTIAGHMVDVVLDLRKGSPTLGKAVMYDMPADSGGEFAEWIWVPPGFAHGNYFPAESTIEYYCSGEYNQSGEAGISPLSRDIDWSLCDGALKDRFDAIAADGAIISDKDRDAPSLRSWLDDPRSDHFRYQG
jgi:dTDP-4-dehydrorhamnose 3,5-epimerase